MTKLIPPRRMLPRWRDTTSAMLDPEAQALQKPTRKYIGRREKTASTQAINPLINAPASWPEELEQELTKWRLAPSLGLAADILSFGIYEDARPKLHEIARAILDNPASACSPALVELANFVLGESEGISIPNEAAQPPVGAIRAIRSRLRDYPANPIALADLAWAHASLGNTRAAYRALITARSLAPSNRHILRALARYLVHIGQPEEAQHYLERAPQLKQDPWLMSALIAVGQMTNRTVGIVKIARAMVENRTVTPSQFSELAGSLATLEMENGRIKESRKLFEAAVIEPTENSLAQLHWAHQELGKDFEMRPGWAQTPRMYELQAFNAYTSGDSEGAIKAALAWYTDEPYSSRPVVLAAFILEVLERFDLAIDLCEMGLRSNPEDETLQHNLIYGLISKGQLVKAEEKLLAAVRKSATVMALANIGFLHLAQGYEEGRNFYDRAVEEFEKRKNFELANMALAFYARALRVTGHDDWRAPLDRALAANQKLKLPSVALIAQQLLGQQDIPLLSNNKPVVPRIKWEYDRDRNTLVYTPHRLL